MNPAAAKRRDTKRTGTGSEKCGIQLEKMPEAMHQRFRKQKWCAQQSYSLLISAHPFPETTTFLNCVQWRQHFCGVWGCTRVQFEDENDERRWDCRNFKITSPNVPKVFAAKGEHKEKREQLVKVKYMEHIWEHLFLPTALTALLDQSS